MATIRLVVEVEDIVLSKDLMAEGFLEKHPMPQIVDPDWVDPLDGSKAPMVDKFVSTKKLVEDELANYLMREINKGLIMKNQRLQNKFTKTMFIKQ